MGQVCGTMPGFASSPAVGLARLDVQRMKSSSCARAFAQAADTPSCAPAAAVAAAAVAAVAEQQPESTHTPSTVSDSRQGGPASTGSATPAGIVVTADELLAEFKGYLHDQGANLRLEFLLETVTTTQPPPRSHGMHSHAAAGRFVSALRRAQTRTRAVLWHFGRAELRAVNGSSTSTCLSLPGGIQADPAAAAKEGARAARHGHVSGSAPEWERTGLSGSVHR
jgi:hypothetical protein